MTISQIPHGEAIFLDANTLVSHFTAHLAFGSACTNLTRRIEPDAP